MGEKLDNLNINQQEKISNNLEAARAEKLKEVEKSLETAIEKESSTIEQIDNAKHEAIEIALKHETAQQEKEAETNKTQENRPLTKKDIEDSYKKTLTTMQSQLSAPSRAFSKAIHNPVVEKVSDTVGNTVARPNIIIAGALGAIASVVIYIIAKHYGYALSGSETIILFAAGWCLGAVVEYIRVGFINRK